MANKAVSTELLDYFYGKLKTEYEAADEKVLADAKTAAQELITEEVNNGKVSENAAAIEALTQTVNTNKTNAENADTVLGERIDGVEEDIGNLEDLNTTSKEDIVSAINEVKASVSAGGEAAVISLKTDETTEGALKTYTVYQGETKVGVIDIPKDLVVIEGVVEVNPAGQDEGTYIKLTIANQTDPLYINVGKLVDIYKATKNATQIQISIDSSTREISATIVAGSVGTTELADNAVTTVKIADANVTLAKLSTAVQASLTKADTAVQSVTEGATNGAIKVDGTEVPVHGLGSAAYTDSTAYDAAGTASAVQEKLDEEVTRAKAAEAQALADAKTYAKQYADEKVGDVDLSGIQTNADAIAALTTRVASEETKSTDFETRISALEDDFEWGTTADIDAMFEN